MSNRPDHVQSVARREAAPFAALAAVADLALAAVSAARGWQLFGADSWWVWVLLSIPALMLGGVFLLGLGRIGVTSLHRREGAIALLALQMVGNVFAIGLVIGTLVSGSEIAAGQLFLSALVVVLVNVITFGLAFWELDCGGPVLRELEERRRPDFQFPQDENPELAQPGWRPGLADFVYLALTNSVAFSPTDAMPLSHRAKLLMALESIVALVTVLVVAARAVNVLGG